MNMTKYETIAGAEELVKKYEEEFSVINNSIAELEKRKMKLEKSLDDSRERFTIESIEKNATAKRDLNLINQYLAEAETQKANIAKQVSTTVFDEAIAVLSEHGKTSVYKLNGMNKAIAEHLYQIRAIYAEMARLEQVEQSKVAAFYEDLKPFFEEEQDFIKRNAGRNILSRLKEVSFKGNGRIFHVMPEQSYLVKGALKADTSLQGINLPKAQELDALYQVDVEQAKKAALEPFNEK